MPDITVHDRSGLLLSSSPALSDEDINQAELVGIAEAADWAKRARLDPKEDRFWQQLHERMFRDVWEWAGQWRRHNPNIGVARHEIQTELRRLQADLAFWMSGKCDMSPLEVLARFHHRLVFVHPFANGNGRWGRLMTDVLATRELRLEPRNDDLRDPGSAERKRYVAAIKAADNNDLDPFMAYLKELNPGLQ